MTANVLTALDAGDEFILGGSLGTCSPSVLEAYGELGLDFAFVDLEHGGVSPWDSQPLGNLARAGELAGVEPIVRLPSGDADAHGPRIRKVLDTGVRNVVIPRVRSVDEVEAAIDATYFTRDDGARGRRGVGATRSSRWGARLGGEGYLDDEDASVRLGVMIENPDIIDAFDDLLALPELGFVFIGNADLSHELGHPLAFDHPEVSDAIGDIEVAVAESDVALGGIYVDDVHAMVDRGYQILSLGSDFGAIYDYFGGRLDEV